jgi:hypothetical protein
VGASIGGLIGMFLIVPTIAILQVTWRSIAALFLPVPEPRREPAAPPEPGPPAVEGS